MFKLLKLLNVITALMLKLLKSHQTGNYLKPTIRKCRRRFRSIKAEVQIRLKVNFALLVLRSRSSDGSSQSFCTRSLFCTLESPAFFQFY